jgi:hypothetical protein
MLEYACHAFARIQHVPDSIGTLGDHSAIAPALRVCVCGSRSKLKAASASRRRPVAWILPAPADPTLIDVTLSIDIRALSTR